MSGLGGDNCDFERDYGYKNWSDYSAKGRIGVTDSDKPCIRPYTNTDHTKLVHIVAEHRLHHKEDILLLPTSLLLELLSIMPPWCDYRQQPELSKLSSLMFEIIRGKIAAGVNHDVNDVGLALFSEQFIAMYWDQLPNSVKIGNYLKTRAIST